MPSGVQMRELHIKTLEHSWNRKEAEMIKRSASTTLEGEDNETDSNAKPFDPDGIILVRLIFLCMQVGLPAGEHCWEKSQNVTQNQEDLENAKKRVIPAGIEPATFSV